VAVPEWQHAEITKGNSYKHIACAAGYLQSLQYIQCEHWARAVCDEALCTDERKVSPASCSRSCGATHALRGEKAETKAQRVEGTE
jgi:hypothetical protein